MIYVHKLVSYTPQRVENDCTVRGFCCVIVLVLLNKQLWVCGDVHTYSRKMHVVPLHYLRQYKLVLRGFTGVDGRIVLKLIFKK